MAARVEYVYCVVPSGTPPARLPAGIDDVPVDTVTVGPLTALVSALDADTYGADRVSERTADQEWLVPRARAHHTVITGASDRGPVVPLPMWVMFSDRDAVATMLATRAPELEAALASVRGAREYTVRIALDVAQLEPTVSEFDPALAELERQAATASPGQAYLLGRKLAAARKDAVQSVAQRVVREIHDALAREARATAEIRPGEERGIVRWDAYLVEDARYDAFRAALTELVGRYEPAGFRFEFTGPWPPFHFVRGA